MVSLVVNNRIIETKPGITILEVCRTIGEFIPRFCYHETLSIEGNCRVCLVEVEGIEKPVAACLTEVSENMIIYTDSAFVRKARENVIETLLLHHPLDCPVCDQAGECDLQDQTKTYASDHTKYFFNKRGVEDKNFGFLIKTIMTRCIHCTRCVRFSSNIAGVNLLGTLNRGSSTEIGTYSEDFFKSEISGNVIDLCPVGAITAKPFVFKARPWELRVNETIDTIDTSGSNIYSYFKDNNIVRILPKSNININSQIITDAARFSYDSHNLERMKYIKSLKRDLNKDVILNWTKFSHKIENIFKNPKNIINFNISDTVGFGALQFLKNINYLNYSTISSSEHGRSSNENSYLWGLSDPISSIDTCDTIALAFSVNSKIECATINARLKVQSLNTILSVINMNINYENNLPTKNLHLNISTCLNSLEGKNFQIMKKLFLATAPLILIGESLKKRGLDPLFLATFLKNKFNNCKILKSNISANSETLEFLNIPRVTKRKKLVTSNQFFFNMSENLSTRKDIFKYPNNIFWFNTHRILHRKLLTKISTRIPLLGEFEEEKVFLNMEQRPQKTTSVFKHFFDARTLKRIILPTLSENIKLKKIKIKHTFFLSEILQNSDLYDRLIKRFIFINLFNPFKINLLSIYPEKSLINNFFRSSKNLEYSRLMINTTATAIKSNFTNKIYN